MQSRDFHTIGPCSTVRFPARIICFGVEPWCCQPSPGYYEHTFRCAAAVKLVLQDGKVEDREEAVFGTKEDFWEWVGKRCLHDRTTWLCGVGAGYSSNILGFWEGVDRGRISFGWGALADPPIIISARLGRKPVRILDIRNWLPGTVGELARICGHDGLDGDLPDSDLSTARDRALSKAKLSEDLLCRVIRELAIENRCGLKSTAAATSWAFWRNSCYTYPVYVHKILEAWSLENSACFGGQLYLKTTGAVGHKIYALDANSMYVSILAASTMPVKFIFEIGNPSVNDVERAVRSYWCLAEVEASPDWPLPWRRGFGKVEYCCDKRFYIVCGATLAWLAGAGRISAVRRLSLYECDVPFASYGNAVWRRRREACSRADRVAGALWKVCGNSFTGRWAQRQRKWTRDPALLCADRWGEWWHRYSGSGRSTRCRAIAGEGYALEDGGPAYNACPAIYAAITERGRLRLRELAEIAGIDNVWYMDTDSLHVSQVGYDRLDAAAEIGPEQLGKLKIVAQGKDAFYWGPKFYRVGRHIVSNIVRPSDRHIAEGIYLQAARDGVERTIASGVLDRVLVRDRPVTVWADSLCSHTMLPMEDLFDGET